MQHKKVNISWDKNINMYWDYSKFPHKPVKDEQYEMIARNTMSSYYHFRIHTKLGKCVCAINHMYISSMCF